MVSAVTICNLALNHLGQPPVISLSDDNKGARVMSLLFDPSRDAVLRLHPWNFATRRATLAQLVAAPAFGFTKAYALPADYLRLLRLNDGRDTYQLEADGLLTDAGTAELRYIARITDTAKFEPLFVQALAAFLAAEAALPITNSQNLEQGAQARFREKLQEARSVDGMESWQEVLMGHDFTDAFLGEGEEFRAIAPLVP